MDELKACPFCGQETVNVFEDHGGDGLVPIFVQCENCGAQGEWDTTRSKAIEFWNTRPAETALEQRVSELEQMVARLINSVDHDFACEMRNGYEDCPCTCGTDNLVTEARALLRKDGEK